MSQKLKKSVVFAALMACTGLTPAYANMLRTAGDTANDEMSIPQMVPQSTAGEGDNLGDHRATETLIMGGYGITGVGLPRPEPTAPGGYDLSSAVNVQFLNAVIQGIEVPELEPDNLGNHTATQTVNLAGHAIINVADSYGGAGHQAVNIRTLNQYLAALPGPDNLGNHIATRTLNLNGNTIQLGSITSYDGSGNPVYGPGIRISGTTITNLGTPVNATDAVNKTYVDSLVSGIDLSGYVTISTAQTITGVKTFSQIINARGGVNVGGQKITNLAAPTANTDAANKAYVDSRFAAVPGQTTYLAGTGLTLTGNTFEVDSTIVRTLGDQTINGIKVFADTIRVPTPATGPDAANKDYVDAQIAAIPAGAIYTAGSGLILSGNTFAVDSSVVRTTGTQTIAGAKTFSSAVTVATPTAGGHATTKAYVDGLFSGVPAAPVYTAGTGLTLTGNTFAVDSTMVRTVGNQTIDGTKTFTSTINIAADTNQGIRFRAADNTVQSMIYGNATSMRLLAYAPDGTTVASQLILLNDGRILPGTGRFDGGNQRITTVADPSAAQDVVNLRTLQAAVAAGGDNLGNHTATLNLNLNNNRIVNVAAPINNTDAATKVYVDNLFAALPPGATYAAGSGLTLTGNIFSADSSVVRTSGTQSIAGAKTFTSALTVQTPISAGHATTKAYVDALVAGAPDSDTTYTAGTGLNLTGTVFSVDNTVVQTTGNQSVGGVKTFTSPVQVVNSFNVDGSGPGQQQNGLYLADLGTVAGTTLSPNMTAAIMGQISTTRSVGFTVDPSGYVYGFRSHNGAGPYTWQSKVREADVANTLSNPYTAGTGLTLTGTTFAVDASVIRNVGNQSIAGVKTFTGDVIVPTPVNGPEAANKAYVDARIAALPAGTTYSAGSGLTLTGSVFAADATVVRTSGDQTIAGNKYFSGEVQSIGNSYRIRGATDSSFFRYDGTNFYVMFSDTLDGSWNTLRPLTIAKATGNVTIGAELSMSGRKITNVATPTVGPDAANKAYVDAAIAAGPNTTYSAGSGLSLSGTTFAVNSTVVRTTGNQAVAGIKNFSDGLHAFEETNNGGIVRFGRSSGQYTTFFGTASGNFMASISSTGNPKDMYLRVTDTVNENDFLFRRDGRISNVANPALATDAANKAYVDSRPDANTTYAAGSGLTLSGTTFAADSTVVRTSGTQTIGGVKSFTSSVNLTSDADQAIWFRKADATVQSNIYTFAADNSVRIGSYTTDTGAFAAGLRVRGTDGAIFPEGTGFFHSNGKKIVSVATPTAGTDAANKAYVDAQITANTNYTGSNGVTISSGNVVSADSTVVRTTGNQTIAGVKTFSGSINIDGTNATPDLVIRRTNAATNANMRFFTTGTGDVTVGQGDNTWFNVGSGDDITWAATGVFAIRTTDGYVRWKGQANGNGAGITNLNAGNLATGTVAEARLPIRNANSTAGGILGYNGHTAAAGEFYGGTTNPGGNVRVNYNGNLYATRMWSTAYYYFSDERLKKDIETISPAQGTEIIKDLRPVSYTWKQDGKEALGVIAQEVQKVIPTAVIENEGGDLAVDYVQMIAPMVAAMQDMEARIAELEAELKAARAE